MRRAESWESLQFVSIRGMHMKMATILVLRFHILLLDCLGVNLDFPYITALNDTGDTSMKMMTSRLSQMTIEYTPE